MIANKFKVLYHNVKRKALLGKAFRTTSIYTLYAQMNSINLLYAKRLMEIRWYNVIMDKVFAIFSAFSLQMPSLHGVKCRKKKKKTMPIITSTCQSTRLCLWHRRAWKMTRGIWAWFFVPPEKQGNLTNTNALFLIIFNAHVFVTMRGREFLDAVAVRSWWIYFWYTNWEIKTHDMLLRHNERSFGEHLFSHTYGSQTVTAEWGRIFVPHDPCYGVDINARIH
jgi:hypothetical protein